MSYQARIDEMCRAGCTVQVNWDAARCCGLVAGGETGEYEDDCAILETVAEGSAETLDELTLQLYRPFLVWRDKRGGA